jgi:cytochrome c biogenesis protein CcdA
VRLEDYDSVESFGRALREQIACEADTGPCHGLAHHSCTAEKQMTRLSAPTAFVAGLIAGINPCLLAVMAFIAGTTLSAAGRRLDILTRIAAFCGGLLTVYLLIEMPRLSRFLFQFVSPKQEPEVRKILASLERVVGGYIRGQVITSLCIAVFTLVVLVILDVKNPLAFAVLAGWSLVGLYGTLGGYLEVNRPATLRFLFAVLLVLAHHLEFRLRERRLRRLPPDERYGFYGTGSHVATEPQQTDG